MPLLRSPNTIKPILDHLREALAFLGEPKTKRASHNNTLVYRLESEILPIMPIRLKVEINCREHFHRHRVKEPRSYVGWAHAFLHLWIKLDFDELPIVSDTFLSALYLKSFSSFAGAASEIGAADPSANAMLSFLTPDT